MFVAQLASLPHAFANMLEDGFPRMIQVPRGEPTQTHYGPYRNDEDDTLCAMAETSGKGLG